MSADPTGTGRGVLRPATEPLDPHAAALAAVCDDAVIQVTPRGTITAWSPAAERIYGYPARDVLGCGLELLAPPDRAGEDAALLAAARAGDVVRIETRRRRRDGRALHVALGLAPVVVDGVVVAITVIARDRTDRVRVRELDAALSRAHEDFEELARVMAHDMQEPLRMVSGFSGLLARRYLDRLDPRGHEFLGYVAEGSDRMGNIIEALRACARVRLERLSRRPVVLRTLVEQAWASLDLPAGADLRINGDVVVFGDLDLLGDLLSLLLDNAVRFRGDAPLRVAVSAAPHRLGWQVSVRDNGIGVRPELADGIFRLFAQLHPRGRYGGAGVGLALARRIVERHGGALWVDPHASPGAVFHFTLPAG